jgi:acetyl esterase/lipase
MYPVYAADDALARAHVPSAVPPLDSAAFVVRDVVYQRHGGKERLARLYRPAGSGPFPAVVLVHGGQWNNKDRTDGQNTALELCNAGILVLALDFRNAPEAPYPASLQDISLGIRWLKAHARSLGTTPERVGLYGTSSGGHQALLAALRPDDARYAALALGAAPAIDAKVAFVISGWGVLFPWDRYNLAKAQGKAEMVKSHHAFFGESQAAHEEATPALILERGENVHLPPAMAFQGTKDEWTTPEQAERLGAAWRARGGTMDVVLFEGERHTFLNELPAAANSVKALAAIIAFVRRHAG